MSISISISNVASVSQILGITSQILGITNVSALLTGFSLLGLGAIAIMAMVKFINNKD